MKTIFQYLKLVRVWNLVMVALLQYMLLYCLIKPSIEHHYSQILGIQLQLQFSSLNFMLLVLSCVFITAAGYVINDYFDLSIDSINNPEKVIVGKSISLRTALALHWVLNIVGVLLGFYVSWSLDMLNLGFIFVFSAGLLWFYSTIFSKELLVGNIIVAMLTAILPLIVAVFEIIPLNYTYVNELRMYYLNFNAILFWILGFSFFAFITNFTREIIKDVEDLEGDCTYGRNTVPIALGVKNAKRIIVSLLLILSISISWAMLLFIKDFVSRLYLFVVVVLPSLITIFVVVKANDAKKYAIASKLLTII